MSYTYFHALPHNHIQIFSVEFRRSVEQKPILKIGHYTVSQKIGTEYLKCSYAFNSVQSKESVKS